MATDQARILVASTLGAVVEPFLGERYRSVVVATSATELANLLPGSLIFDVAVVDLFWNAFGNEWAFDGLDVLSELEASRRAGSVLIAVHGHSFERDHLDEAVNHPLVRGVLVKAHGLGTLATAIDSLATGGTFYSDGLPSDVFDDRLTVGRWFSERDLAARVAGAIASGRASSWAEVATVSSFERSTVEGAPALFGAALCEMGEVHDPAEVNQATIFRWSGEHAQYILSWCRRNGLTQFSRCHPPRGSTETP